MENVCSSIESLLVELVGIHGDITRTVSQIAENKDVLERLNSTKDNYQQILENQKALFQFVEQVKDIHSPPSTEGSETDSSKGEWCDVVESAWDADLSGGCMNHPTWRQNPQILLKVEKEGEITIHLTQKPGEGKETEGVGFYVFNGKDYKELITTNGNPVARSSFSRNDTVSCTFSVSPSEHGYVILPCTFHPNLAMKFSVRIDAGETDSVIRAITDDDSYSKQEFKSNWNGKTAGGCRNYTSFVYNPQFHIQVTKPTTITALLSQTEKDDFDALGLYVFKAPNNCNSKISPEDLLDKGSFASGHESTLRFTVNDSCIVIPCTFHPEKESNFDISFFTSKTLSESIKVTELLDTEEVSVNGEWNYSNAGGCTSYSTWRNNPQYVIKSEKQCDISVRLVQPELDGEKYHPIGIFVFKDTGKRRLLVRPSDVLVSSACSSTDAITLKIESHLLQKNSGGLFTCVVMPCTYYPALEGKFELFASVEAENPLPVIDTYEPFHQQAFPSEWNADSAGGCLNHGATWRNNPQFQFKALQDSKIMVVLHLPNEKTDSKHSIGFYICEAPKEGHKVYSLTEKTIKKRAPFRKSFEAYCPFTVKEGMIYNIIPCTFRPGVESTFSISIFSNQPDVVSLSPVKEHSRIDVSGSWKGDSAGGCLNNASWWLNPRFAVKIDNPVTATFVLVQKSKSAETGNEVDVKPIGLYLSRSDENLEPLLANPTDLLASAPFEPAVDVPSTFYPGEEGDFDILAYTTTDESESISIMAFPTAEEVEITEEEVETVEEVPEPKEPKKEPVVEEEPIVEDEPIIEKPKKEEPTVESTPEETEVSPIPSSDGDGPPPPPPTGNTSKSVPKPPIAKASVPKVKAQESSGDIFQKIKAGNFLRKVSENEKTSYAKRQQTEIFKGFNMDKIIARRTFLEISDDEEEDDWSDHEDDDEWW